MHSLSYLYNLLLAKYNKIPDNFDGLNNYETFDIFEVLCALERSEALNIEIVTWNQYPPEEKHRIGLDIIYQNGTTQYSDVGIDLISKGEDTYIGQCKKHDVKNYINAFKLERTIFCAMIVRENLNDFNVFKKVEIVSPLNVKISRPKINHDNRYIHVQIDEKHLEEKWPNILREKEDELILQNLQKESLILRKCQEDALKYLNENDQDIYKINMACGSGKTLVGLEWIKDVDSWLILVPSTLLLDQIDKILKTYKYKYTLCDYRHKPTNCSKIVCVYNSFEKIKDRQFDRIIVDEAHHILRNGFDGYTYENQEESDDEESEDAEKEDNYLDLIRKNLIDKKVLYLSATLGEADFKYSLRQSIEDKNLVDYNIHIPIYTGNYEEDLINYFKNRIYLYSILAYCNSVEKCISFTKLCNSNGIKADYIESTMNKLYVKKVLTKFEKREIRILVSVNILGEGIDLPFANTCCFIDQRHSYYSIIQCIGRVLRTSLGKNLAHIILPGIKEGTDYKIDKIEMLNFLKTLAEDDPFILDAIKRRSSRFIFDKVERNLKDESEPDEVGEIENIDISEIILDRELRLINNNFDYKCELIKEYVKENNGKLPIHKMSYKDIPIGSFIEKTRRKYKSGKLTQDQINKLNDTDQRLLKFDRKQPIFTTFEQKIKLLKEYLKENENKLPNSRTLYKGYCIGYFIDIFRSQFNNNELSQEKINILNSIDIQILDNDKITFEYKCELLKEYIKENNKFPLHETIYKNIKIGNFVSDCKISYKKEKLSENSIKILLSIDEKIFDSNFMIKLKTTVEYMEQNYGKPPKREIVYKNIPIGMFLFKQRSLYKRSKLSQERIDIFNKTNPKLLKSENQIQFEEKLELVKEYIEVNKKIPTLQTIYKDVNIGSYIHSLRKQNNKDNLPQEKKDILNLINPKLLKP